MRLKGKNILKSIRIIFSFYRSFIIASSIITLVCLGIFQKNGPLVFGTIFLFKILTLGLIYYFIGKYKFKEFYYFQNLGISKVVLWVTTLFFDFALFIILMILTYKIR